MSTALATAAVAAVTETATDGLSFQQVNLRALTGSPEAARARTAGESSKLRKRPFDADQSTLLELKIC